MFSDALSASSTAAAAPLYITDTNCLNRAQLQHMIDAGATKLVIVGGPASVSGAAAGFRNC